MVQGPPGLHHQHGCAIQQLALQRQDRKGCLVSHQRCTEELRLRKEQLTPVLKEARHVAKVLAPY